MTQDELKILVGRAALAYVVPGSVVGVGTGSTVNCFIDALATIKASIVGAVSSSEKSSERLRAYGIVVLETELPERRHYWNVQVIDGLWNQVEILYRQSSLNASRCAAGYVDNVRNTSGFKPLARLLAASARLANDI